MRTYKVHTRACVYVYASMHKVCVGLYLRVQTDERFATIRTGHVRQPGTESHRHRQKSDKSEPLRQALAKSKHSSKAIRQNTSHQSGDISSLVYKPTSCKYNSDVFPFSCGLLVVLVDTACIEANSLPTINPYPFVSVADRVPHTNSKSKY